MFGSIIEEDKKKWERQEEFLNYNNEIYRGKKSFTDGPIYKLEHVGATIILNGI